MPCVVDVERLHVERLLLENCRSLVFNILPSEDKAVRLEVAVAKLQELRQCPMMTEGVLGEAVLFVENVQVQVGLMQNSEGPSLGNLASDVKMELFSRYSYFFHFTFMVEVDEGPARLTEVRGKKGFNMCLHWFRRVHGESPEKLHLFYMQSMAGLGFLMTPEVQAEYRSWMACAARNFTGGEDVDELEVPVWTVEDGETFSDGVAAGRLSMGPPAAVMSPQKSSPGSASKRRKLAMNIKQETSTEGQANPSTPAAKPKIAEPAQSSIVMAALVQAA